jgi:hypothetical protein
LNSYSVEYLIVGGHAVAFHGYPRYTGDIDFLVRRSEENASRIVAAIKEFGFADWASLSDVFVQEQKVVQIGRVPNRIDILTSASGLEFSEVWEKSVAGTLDDLAVRFVDFDSLLRNKRVSGRAKDLADLEQLEKVSKKERR